MEDEDMQNAENEPHNQSPSQLDSQKKKKKKPRGPSKGLKSKSGVPRVLEWDEFYRPIGKWVTEYKTHVGEISRAKVSILIKDWKEVPQGIKDILWEDAKREFHIEEDEKKKKKVLHTCDQRWKDFKAKLVSGWITCTRKMPDDKRMPYEIYDFITPDVWNSFVKEHSTDEFKERSEKARKSQSFNQYPHHLGAKSYGEMDIVWKRKGYIPSSSTTSSCSSVVSSLPDRTYAWLLARSIEDDKGNHYLPDQKTKEVKESIDDWKKQQAEGKFVPNRNDDVLARALGRKDRYGRAIAFGRGVGIKAVWGSGERRSGRRGTQIGDVELEELEARVTQRVRDETVQEMQSKVDFMVQEKFMFLAKEMGIQIPTKLMELNSICQGTPQNRSSCHSGGGDAPLANIHDPFANIQEPVACKLSLMIDSEKESLLLKVHFIQS
ncbi:uncharacterized protein LOC110685917 isoform X1 [Chenopodium quinoa]|uniref:uncharacterized protein LOC110685917 isoform X1 n=1 Tax=Chenopodium quinoa TaxID=63459 RepID=UPI000B794105|nr:uncharacterized protein LOC110685917 isoform X1 [Chenopodium quinoa]XP_021718163.1 uncharacterized protein LOC110685917 isoform X1 [Chenopodium quinoa]XP_021718164.1 uncharacterized protein LOC110685917 isoform X1 [Chenopodium quinoa]XP_021718165.1 uncharacterized protein LOC110685917 isoform X1 [Chenopodium quinoa]